LGGFEAVDFEQRFIPKAAEALRRLRNQDHRGLQRDAKGGRILKSKTKASKATARHRAFGSLGCGTFKLPSPLSISLTKLATN